MNAEGGEPGLKMPTFFPWPPLFSASPPPQTAALLGSLLSPSLSTHRPFPSPLYNSVFSSSFAIYAQTGLVEPGTGSTQKAAPCNSQPLNEQNGP